MEYFFLEIGRFEKHIALPEKKHTFNPGTKFSDKENLNIIISTLFTEIVCMENAPLSTTAKCMKDYYGEFVVHQAAMEGRLKLIKYLHQQGIKLNLKDREGQTPILLAALKEHWNIVYYLHEKISHKKEKSRKIENSLHWSTIGKHFSRVL